MVKGWGEENGMGVDEESILNSKFDMPMSHLTGNFRQVVR